MSIPFTARPLRLLDARGFVWCSAGETYRIVKTRLGRADTLALIDRKVPAVAVPKAERDAAVARIDSIVKRYESANVDYSQIPNVRPAIIGLDVDDAGRLWVRRSTNETAATLFDVFDDTGKLLATVRAPLQVRGMWHPLIRGDVMYTVVVDEDGVQNVVRARIRR
jgi:sugar lactone lactonase YvrE